MKLLQILYSGLGGHGSVALSLIAGDSEKKCSHELLFYGIEDLLPAYRQYCERNNVPYSFIKKRKGLSFTSLKSVIKQIKISRPDAVLLHSPGPLIFPLTWYCRLNRCKLIVVEHTSNEVKGKVEYLMGLIGLFFAAKTVYLTQYYQNQLVKKFFWLPISNNSVVIPNGIDLARFSPGHERKPDDCINAGMIGRFIYPKDQSSLVEAIELLNKSNTKSKVFLHFAGNGGVEEELKEVVKTKGLNKQIIFHGLLDEDQLISFFHSLHIYVHASYAEAMCTSVMQAMACGLPVLASDIPGINNIAVKDKTAILYSKGNISELVNGFVSLLNPSLRDSLGTAGRKIAKDSFSNKSAFEAYLKLISKS